MRSPAACKGASSLIVRRMHLVVLAAAAAVAITSDPRVHAQQLSVRRFTAAGSSIVAAAAEVDRMLRAGALDIGRVQADTMFSGRTHERLAQRYNGVPVFGGELVRQMDGRSPISVFGAVYSDIDLDATPNLSPDAALEVVNGLAHNGTVVGEPELVVLPLGSGGYALAYLIRVKTGFDRNVYFVDAHDGSIALSYSDLQRQSAIGLGTGVLGDSEKVSARAASGTFLADDRLRPAETRTYDMRGNVTRTLNFLSGVLTLGTSDLASSPNNTWTDGADVDAHVYAGLTYDYYFERFGRRGLDDKNLPVTVVVHPANRSDYFAASSDIVGLFYLNAFYAGDGVVVYGEGLPTGLLLSPTRQTVDYFAGGLDVVAHELTHGVTAFSSGLIYLNESGALNEAFSDIMATSTKFFFRPAGPGLLQASYELGSDVIRPGGTRSLDNPALFGDPDHYSRRFIGTSDNGGVHTNCTIVDNAFYLAIEGGANRTSGLAVQGVGAANRDQIEKVFYRGFTLLLTPSATFSMARAATIQAARDLYGAGSAAERAVTQAWTAVGVQ